MSLVGTNIYIEKKNLSNAMLLQSVSVKTDASLQIIVSKGKMYNQSYFNALHHPLLWLLHWENSIQGKLQRQGSSSFKGK